MEEERDSDDKVVELTFDEYMRQQYVNMALPELHELARRDGKSMPDSSSRWDIIDVLLGLMEPVPNSINKNKEMFMHYVQENISFLSEALPCDGNCMAHPTELFLFCLVRSKQAKNHFAKTRSEHDIRARKAGRPPKKRST